MYAVQLASNIAENDTRYSVHHPRLVEFARTNYGREIVTDATSILFSTFSRFLHCFNAYLGTINEAETASITNAVRYIKSNSISYRSCFCFINCA